MLIPPREPNRTSLLQSVAASRLGAGDGVGARAVLIEAVEVDPSNANLMLSLAGVLRTLGRADEEKAILDRLLSLEPRNVQALLQAASLHAAMGDARASAAIYRTALQAIPANSQLSPQMRQVVEAARATINANNRALESFLEGRFGALRARFADHRLSRFDKALATLLLKRRVYRPQPSFMYFPELPAIEFYERSDFPWLSQIEAATDAIRAELFQVLACHRDGLTPYISLSGEIGELWRELNNSRRWSAYFFCREGAPFPENMACCPKTMAALQAWPRCEVPGAAPTAMFSILEPGTRIPPHTGVNNYRLVVHVPLVIPPGSGFRVGAETRVWRPGEALIFDDTIEHEAWNDSDTWRAVLILDIWNPQLSNAERVMVGALNQGVNDFYGELPKYIQPR